MAKIVYEPGDILTVIFPGNNKMVSSLGIYLDEERLLVLSSDTKNPSTKIFNPSVLKLFPINPLELPSLQFEFKLMIDAVLTAFRLPSPFKD